MKSKKNKRTVLSSMEEIVNLAKEFDLNGGQIENIARKRTVELIISGNEPSQEQIREYCRNELISTKDDKRTKIVFTRTA